MEITEETVIEEIVFEEAPEEEEVDEIFTIVEDQPTPQGGMSAFYKYVATTLRYPAQARRMGIEGKVFVQFVVVLNIYREILGRIVASRTSKIKIYEAD